MRSIVLDSALFQGAVSLEQVGEGVKPWRIPYPQFALFPPNGINGTAHLSAGVRLRFASNTGTVRLRIEPVSVEVQLDLVSEGELLQTQTLQPGESEVTFGPLSASERVLEIFLPQKAPTVVKELAIDEGASWSIPEDSRPKWTVYGSSITQCNGAFSPAQTWPAIVARRFGLNLTCFGFSGNCHLEPMVARMIRDREADLISMCLGINVYGGSTLSKRTFQAAVIGLVQIVREKHPDTPIIIQSPIWSPPREEKQNAVGMTLADMRAEVEEAVQNMTALGDRNLHYVNGLTIFHEAYAEHLPDELHPNGTGYAIMGENYGNQVMEPMLARYGLLTARS